MINEIRSYFNSTIKSIDSSLKFDGDLDNTQPVALTSMDRTYKLVIGNLEPVQQDSIIQSTVPVTLVLFKRLNVDDISSFDKAYCKAIDIHAKLQARERLEQLQFIKNVECNSIQPQAIEDDDKAFSFTLQFTVTIDYKYT